MSLMPTLLMGIWRVSAWPCTSSTGFTFGFLTGAATGILRSLSRRYAPNLRGRVWPCASRRIYGVEATPTCRCSLREQKLKFQSYRGLPGDETANSKNIRPFPGAWLKGAAAAATDRRNTPLNSTIDHVGGQPGQYLSAAAEQGQALAGALPQFSGSDLGGLQAENAGVGGFRPGRICADGLAQVLGAAFHIQNVVLDLKRQSDVLRIAIERFPFRRRQRGRARRGQQHARADQSAGLQPMHGLELRKIEIADHRGKIQCLSARHAHRAAGVRQNLNHLKAGI